MVGVVVDDDNSVEMKEEEEDCSIDEIFWLMVAQMWCGGGFLGTNQRDTLMALTASHSRLKTFDPCDHNDRCDRS